MREVNVTIRNADKKSWLDRAQQWAQVVSLFTLPLIVAIGGWWIQRSIATADIEQKYVELAMSILREPLNGTDKSLRKWATQTLAKYSKIPIPAEDLRRLSEGSTVLPKGSTVLPKDVARAMLEMSQIPTPKK